jgi:hypothetical protein
MPLVVVDAANVVGSTPDGWWRDRAGATARLRDRLAPLAERGLGEFTAPLDVLLESEDPQRVRVVVTADRGLRERVTRLGAAVLGPRALA